MYREGTTRPAVLLVALGGRVAGLHPDTGGMIWQNDLTGGGYGSVDLATDGEVVIASASGNKVFALDYATGATLWSLNTTSQGRATIVLEGERVFVAKGGSVDAYTRSGQHLWTQGLPGLGTGRAAIGFPGNLRQADEEGSG